MTEGLEIQPQHNKEDIFSKEQLKKWDDDLRTMFTLQVQVAPRGFFAVIGDGYAVEAYCGGNMTRFHGDMDVRMYKKHLSAAAKAEETQHITAMLAAEQAAWAVHETESDKKIEFREQAEGKPFVQRRRLEIELIDTSAEGRYQKKILRDSSGREYEVFVEDINLLVANKMRVMAKKERPRPQDRDDLQRLLTSSEFNEVDCLQRLARHYKRREGVSEEVAAEKAQQLYAQVRQQVLGNTPEIS